MNAPLFNGVTLFSAGFEFFTKTKLDIIEDMLEFSRSEYQMRHAETFPNEITIRRTMCSVQHFDVQLNILE